MSYHCRVYPAHSTGVIVLYGQTYGVTVLHAAMALCRKKEWLAGYSIVWDCSRITELIIEYDEIDVFTAWMSRNFSKIGPGRSVCIVSSPLHYTVARLFAVKREHKLDRELRIFYRADDAMQWLGVPIELLAIDR